MLGIHIPIRRALLRIYLHPRFGVDNRHFYIFAAQQRIGNYQLFAEYRRKFVRSVIFFFAVDIGNIVPFQIFAADRIDSRCGNFLIITVQSAAGIGVLREIVRCFCAGFYVSAKAALPPVMRCVIRQHFAAFARSVYAGGRNTACFS